MILLSEKQYNDLYRYALHVAYIHTRDRELVYEIVQVAFLNLLACKTEVHSPYAWMRITIKNEIIKQKVKSRKIQEAQSERAYRQALENLAGDDVSDSILYIEEPDIKKYLSTSEYKIYQKLKKHSFSPKLYAEKEHLPYNTARDHKKKIKRNLTAKHLWVQGWRTGPQMLSYNQFYQFKRFIHHLLEYIGNHKIDKLIHYVRPADKVQIDSLLSEVKILLEWYFTQSKGYHLLVLVCKKADGTPKIFYLHIGFSKRNIIHIEKAYEPPVLFKCVGDRSKLEPYKEKGIIKLSKEQILNIITDKQIKD